MQYKAVLDYLYSRLPMFQRQGVAAYKADLSGTLALCEVLDHPEKEFKSIHIAGTNGKGSVAHMLASILQAAGYKTGLYTSPHLKDFRERIKINGKMISQSVVIDFVETHKAAFEKIQLSFFEWTVGLAFSYFSQEQVDIAIVEVGMGGRLDSTNVVEPELSIITNISKDHTQYLGDTIEKIAIEKAGIIKKNIPVLIGETQAETTTVFLEMVRKQHSLICWADQEIKSTGFTTDLKGLYQQKNIKTVIQAVKMLKNKGWQINDKQLRNGLNNVVKNTGLQGRWQVLNNKPLTICDTGHNIGGITYVVQALQALNAPNYHIVFGTVNDKAIDEILSRLPQTAHYYFCKASIERALDAQVLKKEAEKYNLKGAVFPSVKDAYESARKNAAPDDVVFIGGSTFVVAEVL